MKRRDNSLHGLLPKRDDDEVPDADCPCEGFGNGVIEHARNGWRVDDDLNEGGHCVGL